MATKKKKKKKDLTITNPYAFFTKGRSKKAIEMDYSMKAKPPSREEKRVNRTDYPGENFYYLAFFKKHNIAPPKKATKKKTTKKSSAAKTTKKKTTSKKKISEPQITEKEPQVGDIIKLKSGRIDKIIKVIPEDDWHFKRYMTQEVNPPAGQQPKIGKLYYKPDINGIRDFEIIEQNPEKKITEKTTQKKVKEPKIAEENIPKKVSKDKTYLKLSKDIEGTNVIITISKYIIKSDKLKGMSNVPKNMTTFIKQGMIDFDYDGKKFRGTYWFNKETIHLHCRYKNPGTYKIFIKITDIFDNETTRILTVTIPSYKRETKKLKLYVANTMTYEELVKAIEKHTNYKETYLRTLGKPELEYLYNDTILKDFPKKFNKETTTKKVVEKKEPVKKPAAKKTASKKNEIKVTNKTSNSKKEILDKLSSIKTYQSPLQSIHYSYKYNNNYVIKVTDNPDCFAHPLMILLDRNKNEIDKWLERYINRRETQYETVIKILKDNSKSEKLLPVKFIELVELDEEEKYTFAYLKTKYIAIVEIDNKKYMANPYLLKWLIKEKYEIYAKKEILQDNFDTLYSIHTDFFVILKKNDEIKGLVSSLIYKDEDLTNIYREKTSH